MWCVVFVVFFFKQKTAYEMRIGDWRSDVCSSDLGICRLVFVGAHLGAMGWRGRRSRPSALLQGGGAVGGRDLPVGFCRSALGRDGLAGKAVAPECAPTGGRSEEHTSELQSLMRISYAVFCLKKKKT